MSDKYTSSEFAESIATGPLTQQRDIAAVHPATNAAIAESPKLSLTGKSVLVVEDEPLIAMTIESALREAGVVVVKIVRSMALARRAIEDSDPFDAAIVDLHVADGDASPLIEILSERGVPVVVTTGGSIDREQPDLGKAVAVLQKPYPEDDLVKVIAWLVK